VGGRQAGRQAEGRCVGGGGGGGREGAG